MDSTNHDSNFGQRGTTLTPLRDDKRQTAQETVDTFVVATKKASDTWISTTVISGTIRFGEFLIIAVAGFLIYYGYVLERDKVFEWGYVFTVSITAVAAVLSFEAIGLYSISSLRNYIANTSRLISIWTILVGTFTAVIFISKFADAFSRVWLASWYLSALIVLTIERGIVAGFIRKWNEQGRLQRNAVVVGGGASGHDLIQALEGSSTSDIRISGIFDDRSDARSPGIIAGIPKLGNIDELVEFARRVRVDLLIVTFPVSAESRLLEVLKKLWVLPVDIRLSAHTYKLRFRPRAYSYIGNVPFLDVFDKPLTDWSYILKRLEDQIISLVALVFALPIMLIVAIAIKLDSRGPVLFKQNRYGFNNELIEVYKFRSMYTDQSDAKADKLVTKDDPRVTKVGRFIRKTSLDELPQLFNSLKGDLSLVGPRPHAVSAKAADKLYTDVVDGYFARHRVRPGITGWAQINGWRGETDTAEKIERRVEHDLYYIENWSILFDLYILAMTPISLLNTESAY
jgi:Undecaprenyl-phosphate glucose phosphotransferase